MTNTKQTWEKNTNKSENKSRELNYLSVRVSKHEVTSTFLKWVKAKAQESRATHIYLYDNWWKNAHTVIKL